MNFDGSFSTAFKANQSTAIAIREEGEEQFPSR